MNRACVFFLCTLVWGIARAQQGIELNSQIEQQTENMAQRSEAAAQDDSYLQSLLYFKTDPLNLNTATVADLREFTWLNSLQIEQFMRYRTRVGLFISIYELQAIPSWDVDAIRQLLPYVQVKATQPIQETLRTRLSNGERIALSRVSQTIERSKGYAITDPTKNRYIGSPTHYLERYVYNYKNLLRYGITLDKDAGEPFHGNKQPLGFDFVSFHIFIRKIGCIKALAIGDFTTNFGQGLIQWQSLAFKKTVDVINVKRQAEVLRPYAASGEYNYQRGIGITLGYKKWEATAYAAHQYLDANIGIDSVSNADFVSSVLSSGYHRTPTEIANKNKLTQTAFGGNMSFNLSTLHIGINGVYYRYNAPLQKNISLYNPYTIAGTQWANASLDYGYTHNNTHFFGEWAIDYNRNTALITGMEASLANAVDVSFVYRNIPPTYQSLYGNAFTETTLPTNESGAYAGLALRISPYVTLQTYADLFVFNGLRYRVNSPSKGSSYLLQLTYKPSKLIELYGRYLYENKAINFSGLSLPLQPVVYRPKQNLRLQLSYVASLSSSYKCRVENSSYDGAFGKIAENGFLFFIEHTHKLSTRFTLNNRIYYFKTDSYDTRLYAYETDVLYHFSIPFFYNEGYRYYVNLAYKLNPQCSLWLKWAQTIYKNQTTISSGLDQIKGNTKSDLSIQLLYRF